MLLVSHTFCSMQVCETWYPIFFMTIYILNYTGFIYGISWRTKITMTMTVNDKINAPMLNYEKLVEDFDTYMHISFPSIVVIHFIRQI